VDTTPSRSRARSQARNRATVDRDTQPRSVSRAQPVRTVAVGQSVCRARIAARQIRRSAESRRKSVSAASRTAASQCRRSTATRWPGGTARATRSGVATRRPYAAGPCPRRSAVLQPACRARRLRRARARRVAAAWSRSSLSLVLVRRPVAAWAVTAAGGAGHALIQGEGRWTHGTPKTRPTIRARPGRGR